jgi:predicted Zn finger-like uncharacterized protein
MFTVCPKCALTLVVTAADLRVAQGYVRCGRCLNVFNALARLSEERPSAAPAAAPDTTAAGSPPEQPPAPSQPSAPSPQVEHTAEDTGEIDVELDASLFVTSTRLAAPEGAAEAEEAAEASETQSLAPEPAASAPPAAPPAAVSTPLDPASLAGPASPDSPVSEERAPAATAAEAASGEPRESPLAKQAAPEQKAEAPPPVQAPDAEQTNIAQQRPESGFELEARRPRAGLAWMLGAGALTLALALQIVNHYRDALAAHPALSGPLGAVYSALGVKLAPRWNIHAYDVRQLGASVAGAVAGEIVVRASVKNSASRAQPLPLLRVTLQDRFGNRIAARDVPPGDYLPSPVAPGSLLAAGSRVDATMVFVDPGPQAVGFEIDACLPLRNGAVACAHGP